jgi:hypothetical protein
MTKTWALYHSWASNLTKKTNMKQMKANKKRMQQAKKIECLGAVFCIQKLRAKAEDDLIFTLRESRKGIGGKN